MSLARSWLTVPTLLWALLSCSGGGGGGGFFFAPDLGLAIAFGGIGFSQPVKLVQHPTLDTRWYVVQQGGEVVTFDESDPAGTRETVLDVPDQKSISLGSGEQGLLSMAFSPNFDADGEIYLAYTNVTASPDLSVLERWVSTSVDDTSFVPVEVLMTIDQPAANHNGADLSFGPDDDLLYYSMGDGGTGGVHGQDTTTLLGTVMRIDVLSPPGSDPYVVPPANVFSANDLCEDGDGGADDCPEIFAWGFRNPFRMNFDPDTGLLYLGDVGQSRREEIDLVVNGGNYGWNCVEGNVDFNFVPPCDRDDFEAPEVVHVRAEAASIIGGAVYRGSEIPDLVGFYVYGDFVRERFFAFRTGTENPLDQSLGLPGQPVVNFAQDREGEIYVVSLFGTPSIRKLVPADS